jgi:hypothetical protein
MASSRTASALSYLLSFTLLGLVVTPARAGLFSLDVAGTISANTTTDTTIPVGTPFSFELIYDTAAPDLDVVQFGSADPTSGRFGNSSSPPALTFFHYQAGSYEVTIDNPSDFGPNSAILVTFTAIHALDININGSSFFPPLAGGPVSFHADFNDFSSNPIFVNDGLPTNTALSLASFDDNAVTLLPPSGVVTSSALTSLTLRSVPEPSTSALASGGLLFLLIVGRKAPRAALPSSRRS